MNIGIFSNFSTLILYNEWAHFNFNIIFLESEDESITEWPDSMVLEIQNRIAGSAESQWSEE